MEKYIQNKSTVLLKSENVCVDRQRVEARSKSEVSGVFPMSKLAKFSSRFLRDEEGATAIEYGLLAALIAVAIITTAGFLGDEIDQTFKNVESELAAANKDNGGEAKNE
ncbi:Flp family type IVb pilin [Amaricoccus tamworthensis]|uniref:Flp family type IVb pilin n=1 Tax=Amaricoccus tamworthensis TaxID=57002 RepID=UPI003C7D48EC